MQDNVKENQNKKLKESPKLLDLTPEDKRNLTDFFALLIKVDKRINPLLYKLKTQKND